MGSGWSSPTMWAAMTRYASPGQMENEISPLVPRRLLLVVLVMLALRCNFGGLLALHCLLHQCLVGYQSLHMLHELHWGYLCCRRYRTLR